MELKKKVLRNVLWKIIILGWMVTTLVLMVDTLNFQYWSQAQRIGIQAVNFVSRDLEPFYNAQIHKTHYKTVSYIATYV